MPAVGNSPRTSNRSKLCLPSTKPQQYHLIRFAMSTLEGNNDSTSGVLPLEAGNALASITARTVLCVQSFNRLTELLRDSDRSRDFKPYISAVAVHGESDKFKLWTASLRDAKPASQPLSGFRKGLIKNLIVRLLRDLNHALTECEHVPPGLQGER